ncbi:MAG: hypothetical protein HW391_493 [Chloroflexi bacterium]|nr:hypothetical protein [Chloroflexota bacterium]
MSNLRPNLARIGRATLLAGLTGILVVSAAFAGKPGGSTTSTFRVDNGTFASTTTAYRGTGTWVHAKCSQNGVLVYEQYVPYGTTGTASLTLGPTPMWTSGGATCSGEDGWWQNGTRWRVNSTKSFTVTG